MAARLRGFAAIGQPKAVHHDSQGARESWRDRAGPECLRLRQRGGPALRRALGPWEARMSARADMWLFAGLAGVAPRWERHAALDRDLTTADCRHRVRRLVAVGIHGTGTTPADETVGVSRAIGRLSESARPALAAAAHRQHGAHARARGDRAASTRAGSARAQARVELTSPPGRLRRAHGRARRAADRGAGAGRAGPRRG